MCANFEVSSLVFTCRNLYNLVMSCLQPFFRRKTLLMNGLGRGKKNVFLSGRRVNSGTIPWNRSPVPRLTTDLSNLKTSVNIYRNSIDYLVLHIEAHTVRQLMMCENESRKELRFRRTTPKLPSRITLSRCYCNLYCYNIYGSCSFPQPTWNA